MWILSLYTLTTETLTCSFFFILSSDWCPRGRCECGGVRRQFVPAALLWQRWCIVQGVGQTDSARGQTAACRTAGWPPRWHHLHPQQGGGRTPILFFNLPMNSCQSPYGLLGVMVVWWKLIGLKPSLPSTLSSFTLSLVKLIKLWSLLFSIEYFVTRVMTAPGRCTLPHQQLQGSVH